MSRTAKSRRYLFSGLLRCGLCGSRLVIVSGSGQRGYVKYGCPSHRYRGICGNRLTIRQDRLEAQLLDAIRTARAVTHDGRLRPTKFDETLQRRLQEERKHNTSLPGLEEERAKLQAQLKHLVEAIADAGHSPSLLSHLSTIEAKLAQVEGQIAAINTRPQKATAEEIRSFVLRNVINLRDLLHNDACRGRRLYWDTSDNWCLSRRTHPTNHSMQ